MVPTMLESLSPDPNFDLFSEYTVQDDNYTSLLDLFPLFDEVQSEPIPSIEHAETLRAELFGTSACDLEPFENFETTSYTAQDVTEGLFEESLTAISSQANDEWQTPSTLSCIDNLLASSLEEPAEPTNGLLPAFSEEPLVITHEAEKPALSLTVEELLAENARLRALVASQVEPKTPKTSPLKRAAGLLLENDYSPIKKPRQISNTAVAVTAQEDSTEALWAPSSSFEYATSVQHVSVASNLSPTYDGDCVTHEVSGLQGFVTSPPPSSPFKANFAPEVTVSAPTQQSCAPKLSPDQVFYHTGAPASCGEDIPSAPTFTTNPQISSPAAKKPRAKRAPAKKPSTAKSTEKKKPAKKQKRVKSTPVPASTHQIKRSLEEIYTLNFYSLTQEEKARLLLPLLQGRDPRTADTAEANALIQAAQSNSSLVAATTMVPRPSTPVASSVEAPQAAEFIALGFNPADPSPSSANLSNPCGQTIRYNGISYVAASPERVTAGSSATQPDENTHLLTELQHFNSSDGTVASVSSVQPAADTEFIDDFTTEPVHCDTAALLNSGHTNEDVSFTLDTTADSTADFFTSNAELDAIIGYLDSDIYSNELDVLAQFNNEFDDTYASYSPEQCTSYSPTQQRSQSPAEHAQGNYAPDALTTTSISMVPAADMGATRQREALEKAARLHAQGRRR